MMTLIKCDRHLENDMHESWVIPNDFQNAINLYGVPFILPEVMFVNAKWEISKYISQVKGCLSIHCVDI